MADEIQFAIVGSASASPTRKDSDDPLPVEQPLQTAADPTPAELEDTLIQTKPKRLTKKRYERDLETFRPEWKTIEHEVEAGKLKLVVLVEGRDVARDRGIVSRISEFADPRICRVAHVDAAGARERSQWFFQPYVSYLPAAGEMTLFDGAWYARAALGRATGALSPGEYADVLRASADFERVLVRSGITVVKFWLTVEGDGQEFPDQIATMAKRWRVSTAGTIEHAEWEAIRDQAFALADSVEVPWRIVTGPDKREVRLRFLGALASMIAIDRKPAPEPEAATDEPGHEEEMMEEPED